jgi:hypothetical protein
MMSWQNDWPSVGGGANGQIQKQNDKSQTK